MNNEAATAAERVPKRLPELRTVASNHAGSASSSSHFIQRPSPTSVPGLAASAAGPVVARR